VIISRYLTKEILTSLLGVTLVLLLIFLSNQLVRYLSYAAAGKIATGLVLQLMGFEIPYLLALLLPLGLYLGIILAYGRLYADSEMPVIQACGISVASLVKITTGLAVAIATLVCVLMLYINPVIALDKDKTIAQNNILDTLRPGRFQVLNEGRQVVYVEKISRDRTRAQNLFIAEQQKSSDSAVPVSWVVVSAGQGFQEKHRDTKENFIVATQGNRYEGAPGQDAYKVIQFDKYGLRVPLAINNPHEELESIPTHKLWHDYDNSLSAAELQWRLSIPLSALVLMLLAIPLSQVRPRQGRYSSLLPAILIYIIYVNLMFVARNWVEIKMLPSVLGMWWVHLLMLGLAGMLYFFQWRYQLRSFTFFKRRALS
jgi:lipopolysaccharide export system permease protein